jgi:C4-dicarboxylate transporter, DcuC family
MSFSIWPMAAGILVVALAIYAIAKQIDVRLALFLAALTLGALAGAPQQILKVFFKTFADEKFLVPICSAMGFAYVLKHTGCDQHLVRLLVRPLTKVRFLLVPGTVVVGFLVNMPIVSQTSTAVTIGTVVIPVLHAARVPPITIGAALLLGSSIGGELFNPGAPELRTTVTESQKAAQNLGLPSEKFNEELCVERIMPLNLLGLAVATAVFWCRSARENPVAADETDQAPPPDWRINYGKALVPLVPIVLLYLTAAPWSVLEVRFDWLMDGRDAPEQRGVFNSRLIGAAMLLGVAIAALAAPRRAGGVARAFFEGAGYGFANIVSLIVIASCFGEGIRLLGWADLLGAAVGDRPDALIAAAGSIALGFACLCGSGMAATQSLFGFFAEPALKLGLDPTHVGAVVSLAAAAGRTMSPVAAVTLMCAHMTGTSPFALMRRVAPPLLLGVAAIIVVAILLAPAP